MWAVPHTTLVARIVMATAGAFLVIGVVGHSCPAGAATFVVPNSLTNVEGNINNCAPLTGCFDSDRYQQVYAGSEFGALAGSEFISQIAFRPDDYQGTGFSINFANIQIELSTTSAAPDRLSTSFGSNVGADVTIVYSGALALSSSNTGGPPKDFDVVIDLQTPFLYDPTAGNLLLEWRNLSGESVDTFILDAVNDPAGSVSRLFSFGSGPNVATGIEDSIGLVTQFTTTVIPVPAAFPLFGAAIAILGVAAWRKRKTG